MYILHNIILNYLISHHPRRLFETWRFNITLDLLLPPALICYLKQAFKQATRVLHDSVNCGIGGYLTVKSTHRICYSQANPLGIELASYGNRAFLPKDKSDSLRGSI